MEPLRDALLLYRHTVTFVVEVAGSICMGARTPNFAHVIASMHDIQTVLGESTPPDGVVCSCSITKTLQQELQEQLPQTTLFFLISDARKVLYKDIIRRFPRGRGILLANERNICDTGARLPYYSGLPRFDAIVRIPEAERIERRRALRVAATGVKEDDFVVLFVGQRSETARPFHDVATAMRTIHSVTPDFPIRRVLAVLPWPYMDPDESVLWKDVLAMQATSLPGVRVLPDITTIQRDVLRDEKLRSSNPRLTNATIADVVLAADLVISSTSSVLLIAAALRTKALSYYADGFGATAYKQEITGNVHSWEWHPQDRCMRIARNYAELRNAIESAIPRRNPNDTLEHQHWPEQDAATVANFRLGKMLWALGSNTNNCYDAIMDSFRIVEKDRAQLSERC